MTDHTTQAAHEHPEPNYMGIFAALAILTVAEIGVVFTPLAKLVIGGMLVILAFSKALLVAGYFMHLKFERRTLGIIAATPILLCVFLMFMLLPDSDPTAPGRPDPDPPAAASSAH